MSCPLTGRGDDHRLLRNAKAVGGRRLSVTVTTVLVIADGHSSVVNCPSSVINCQLSAVSRQLSLVSCQLPAGSTVRALTGGILVCPLVYPFFTEPFSINEPFSLLIEPFLYIILSFISVVSIFAFGNFART